PLAQRQQQRQPLRQKLPLPPQLQRHLRHSLIGVVYCNIRVCFLTSKQNYAT
ncbi:unnamed protein product, partial [Rotaria magnacalcarata]